MDVLLTVGTVEIILEEYGRSPEIKRFEGLIREIAMKMVLAVRRQNSHNGSRLAAKPIETFVLAVAQHLVDTKFDRRIWKWREGFADGQFEPLKKWEPEVEVVRSTEMVSFVTEVETAAGFNRPRVLSPCMRR
jgi:hypothetical protein